MKRRANGCVEFAHVLALALLLAWPGVCLQAATNLVTSTADAGTGSLREAIANATAGDTLIFAPELSGQTITLTSGQLVVDKSLTLDGSSLSNRVTVSGNNASRVFQVPAGGNVNFNGVVICNGGASDNGSAVYAPQTANINFDNCIVCNTRGGNGAIWGFTCNISLHDCSLSNHTDSAVVNGFGTLKMEGCHVSDNGETAVWSYGQTTINNSAFCRNSGVNSSGALQLFGSCAITNSSFDHNSSGLGGAINISDFGSETRLVVERCTFSNNSAEDGGAIYGSSIFHIQNSTFYKNSAVRGGGIFGGGILAFYNVTMANNTTTESGGGIYASGGILSVNHCTISANSGGFGGGIVSYETTFTLNNSICAGNVATNGTNIYGTLNVTQGTNLVDVAPKLAPLNDYGGPTWTMPPLPGSPTIDATVITPIVPITVSSNVAGVNATNSTITDQRGVTRPNGLLPDIGAVEAFPFSSLTLVDTDGDGIDDRLEPAYPQLTVGVNDHALDTDGDGSPDWQELANMTDPNDPASVFKILQISPSLDFEAITNPVFNITLRTFPGLQYELETSGSLTNFQPAASTTFTATNTTQILQLKLGNSHDFLRARRL